MNVPILPTVNATLNGLAAVFLLLGWIAIKKGRPEMHRYLMAAALVASATFLSCYLYYHYHAGSVRYQGEGPMRMIYFAILLTHTPLAALMTPFVIAAVIFAMKGQYARHTRITRWLWPVWMYVSITGVVIYVMLYLLPHGQSPLPVQGT
ncbi:MAG: hypothetical protein AMXMBFR84_25670 [Candidatus Hydrogenedentota bacterium]